MYDPMYEQRQHQAVDCLNQATDREDGLALPLLQKAMLLYAEAYRLALAEQEVSTVLTRARADACRRYGEALARQSRHAEAANVFQEAVDLYGELISKDAQELARECARMALTSIKALDSQPHNRLYLLIAHHERQRQQLALQSGTMAQQGDCSLHIAQIFLRRNRPNEAYDRYLEALELYRQAETSDAVCLAQADCHHHLGDLLADVLPYDADHHASAVEHYTLAIALCRQYESAVDGKQEQAEKYQQALNRLQARRN